MSELSMDELERVAADYDTRLAPALFEPWTRHLVSAASLRPGERALDVACGTGVLARALAARVGAEGSVHGIDVNPGMLAVAARRAPGIEWRSGSAEALPYDDGSFDAVFCQFGLMFLDSPEEALREMARVLAPGGRLVVAVFDSLERIDAYARMAEVYARTVGPEAGEALRLPFSMGDRERLASLLDAVAPGEVEIASPDETARFPDARGTVLADVKGWLPFAGFRLDEATIEAVVREAETALRPFVTGRGTVEFPVRSHVAAARSRGAVRG